MPIKISDLNKALATYQDTTDRTLKAYSSLAPRIELKSTAFEAVAGLNARHIKAFQESVDRLTAGNAASASNLRDAIDNMYIGLRHHTEWMQQLNESLDRLFQPFRAFHQRLVESGLESPELHTPQFEVLLQAILAHNEQNPGFLDDEILRFWVTYDIVIVLESKIKAVITKAMHQRYGDEWWRHMPRKVRDDCAYHKQKREAGHSRELPIEAYLSLQEMLSVFKNHELWSQAFAQYFPRVDQVGMVEQIESLRDVRNDTAHLRPIDNASFGLFVLQAKFVVADMDSGMEAFTAVS